MISPILIILPVVFHRVGLILSIIGAVILIAIPYIYTQEEDKEFAVKLSKIMIYITRTGLLILVLTGIFRLLMNLPQGFIFKLIAVIITLYWSIFRLPIYPSQDYQQKHTILLILICLTSLIGILL